MYLEDHVITTGHINRQILSDYFGTEQSTGSMDISAYIAAGGPIRRALRHETPLPMKTEIERGIGAGRPLGSRGYYVRADGGEWITGSTEERRAAWGLLPHGIAGGAKAWFAECVGAYVADMGGDTAPEYFGISAKEVEKAGEGSTYPERAKVWEYFR